MPINNTISREWLMRSLEHRIGDRRVLRLIRELLKARVTVSGRQATDDRAACGAGKPQTFDFLGFAHICGRTKRGGFRLAQRPRRDRKRAKLLGIVGDLRGRR